MSSSQTARKTARSLNTASSSTSSVALPKSNPFGHANTSSLPTGRFINGSSNIIEIDDSSDDEDDRNRDSGTSSVLPPPFARRIAALRDAVATSSSASTSAASLSARPDVSANASTSTSTDADARLAGGFAALRNAIAPTFASAPQTTNTSGTTTASTSNADVPAASRSTALYEPMDMSATESSSDEDEPVASLVTARRSQPARAPAASTSTSTSSATARPLPHALTAALSRERLRELVFRNQAPQPSTSAASSSTRAEPSTSAGTGKGKGTGTRSARRPSISSSATDYSSDDAPVVASSAAPQSSGLNVAGPFSNNRRNSLPNSSNTTLTRSSSGLQASRTDAADTSVQIISGPVASTSNLQNARERPASSKGKGRETSEPKRHKPSQSKKRTKQKGKGKSRLNSTAGTDGDSSDSGSSSSVTTVMSTAAGVMRRSASVRSNATRGSSTRRRLRALARGEDEDDTDSTSESVLQSVNPDHGVQDRHSHRRNSLIAAAGSRSLAVQNRRRSGIDLTGSSPHLTSNSSTQLSLGKVKRRSKTTAATATVSGEPPSKRRRTLSKSEANTLLGSSDKTVQTNSNTIYESLFGELLSGNKKHTLVSTTATNENQTVTKIVYKITDIQEDLECAICSEIMVSPVNLNCGHTFCDACVQPWIDTNKDCPTCRTKTTHEPVRSYLADRIIKKHLEALYASLEHEGKHKEAKEAREERLQAEKDAEKRRITAAQEKQRKAAEAAAAAQQAIAARGARGGWGAHGDVGGWRGFGVPAPAAGPGARAAQGFVFGPRAGDAPAAAQPPFAFAPVDPEPPQGARRGRGAQRLRLVAAQAQQARERAQQAREEAQQLRQAGAAPAAAGPAGGIVIGGAAGPGRRGNNNLDLFGDLLENHNGQVRVRPQRLAQAAQDLDMPIEALYQMMFQA